MEDLQLEEQLDGPGQTTASNFTASFIDPIHLSVEDKMKFESLFDLPKSPKTTGTVYFY